MYMSENGGLNRSSTAKSDSSTRLILGNSDQTMNTRLLYGSAIVLVVVVLALVIALAVVASDKNNSASGSAATSASQTKGDNYVWPVPDCSHATDNLAKARCVLDSYPLVDGYVSSFICF